MSGSTFLIFYWIAFVLLWFTADLLCEFDDSLWTPLAPVIVFVAIGLVRVAYGLSHDMHRFMFIFLMMVIGLVLIFEARNAIKASWFEHRAVRLAFPLLMGLGGVLIFLAFGLLTGESDGGDGGGGGGCGGGGCGGCGG